MAHSNLKVIDGGNEPSVGTEKWSKEIREKAKSLADDLDNGYMEMARLLWKIYDTPIEGDPKRGPVFTQWGYGSFAEYCQEELGMHKKRAQRLRNIWFKLEVVMKDQIDPEVKKRLVALGFSKVRELVRKDLLTPKNVERWVEKAEELSYPKLCKAIQTFQERQERAKVKRAQEAGDTEEPGEGGSGGGSGGGGGGPQAVDTLMKERDDYAEVPDLTDEDLHRRTFMLYTEQADMVDQALDRAKQLSESDVKSNNLHLICMDFLAHNDFGKANREQVLRHISQLERIYSQRGLKLIVAEGDDVIYGLDTLERLASAE